MVFLMMLATAVPLSAASAENFQGRVVASILGGSANKAVIVGAPAAPDDNFQDRLAAAISQHFAPVRDRADRYPPTDQARENGSGLQERLAASMGQMTVWPLLAGGTCPAIAPP